MGTNGRPFANVCSRLHACAPGCTAAGLKNAVAARRSIEALDPPGDGVAAPVTAAGSRAAWRGPYRCQGSGQDPPDLGGRAGGCGGKDLGKRRQVFVIEKRRGITGFGERGHEQACCRARRGPVCAEEKHGALKCSRSILHRGNPGAAMA